MKLLPQTCRFVSCSSPALHPQRHLCRRPGWKDSPAFSVVYAFRLPLNCYSPEAIFEPLENPNITLTVSEITLTEIDCQCPQSGRTQNQCHVTESTSQVASSSRSSRSPPMGPLGTLHHVHPTPRATWLCMPALWVSVGTHDFPQAQNSPESKVWCIPRGGSRMQVFSTKTTESALSAEGADHAFF